jgi:hypothetical protein
VNGRELRAARKDKLARRFAALAEPVAPPVEMDEHFFARVDAAPGGDLYDENSATFRKAWEAEVQRNGTAI